ncbi:sulfite exporter TauE/SafE family protein [Cupriavidus taiwanensis]|uniref:sulfite exporter TauE/SafE family protein n=1 Tax=Cupriavidus taiwanensis TaxID=164546 RepID=UPI000E10CA55|nr:sulfite exporter TauE/SafE family protein [Cupriavidus taiwanensis]SOY43265.1 putative inner membrane lipoprotein [Cupriavidus taiwanensis]SOY45746.1 putative inner membrane lipoprotein [Cupriavidus taiwanensis]SOY81190.1 putative inner membrane lipoprotein [Cupriavidus taiwanensis]SOZ54005.1 putative inner membrane lipoprotein [Cupriavidus taiwanensis]SOZ77751.1 putative inner membrane lipoprotein [Cupriavidus taiwanensis]
MTFGVLISVFLLALLGGVHCAAMCGGVALAVEQRRCKTAPVGLVRSRTAWLGELLVMHFGRISTYMLLGAALGAAGATAWRQDYLPVQRWLFGAGSLMLLWSGWRLLRGSTFTVTWLERLAARASTAMAGRLGGLAGAMPAFVRARGGLARRYGVGLAWGLVPCGMVYGALTLALLAGNAGSGALVMGVFGLGTLPNLLVLSGLSGYLRLWSRRPGVRLGAGLAVMAFGGLGIARAVLLPHSLAEQGFCLVF